MDNQRVCLTIHNIGHQGVIGGDVLNATGLGRPDYYFHKERLQDNHHPNVLNLLKGGIVYSNFVTTVSPHYAWETMHTSQDMGLSPTLWTHKSKFGGVLNGIDYDVWNPEIDTHIACPYSVEDIDQKYENKRALRNRFWLREGYKPIVAYVGRLDGQKGVHLVRHALFYSLLNHAQFVLLGPSPDPSISSYFWHLKRHLNDNPDCHLELNFSSELAHLIYAGADILVMPSNYEPCGLVQMIALKYGTVPVVRAVGGLADTVFDRDFGKVSTDLRNGYVFDHPDYTGIESAMKRAFGLWFDYPKEFRNLMLNGMQYDYSWNHPGRHYFNIYDLIRNK
jgi:starch synthase